MHARGATFDYAGSDLHDVRQGFEEIKRRAAGRFNDELPALELFGLYDPDDGTVLSITLLETEEDLRRGDAARSAMGPPRSGVVGRRVSVEML